MQARVSYNNLSPLSFLDRSAFVYPNKPAVVYKDRRYTYAEFNERVNRLAGALKKSGIQKSDRVAFLVPNIPPMLEGHYGPMRLAAVLVAINIRLSPREIAYILNHSGAKLLVFDSELAPTVRALRDEVERDLHLRPGRRRRSQGGRYPGDLNTRSSWLRLPPGDHREALDSELDTITINYTSGTTGLPKGVEYNARGAYLNGLGEVIECGLNWTGRYLWTLPMFHCNGWCLHLGG